MSSLQELGQDVILYVPEHDAISPEVSIVIPARDEALTIEEFVSWCHEGLAQAGVVGEVLIVDSSTDETPTLALEAGARVLRTPGRGLGRAYIDAIPYIRAPYVIMGDADCTYDFRELAPFLTEFRKGSEFIMGSRYAGSIEKGAMPALHRYFGTPITTFILNRVYKSHFSDIHCGMRGITKDALLRLGLTSQSWEYASEMILKAVRLDLVRSEVPVSFYKDRNGRVSHHKRVGWTSPIRAGWINLREIFIYKADYFALKPGLFLFVLGLAITLALSGGEIRIGKVIFNLFWLLFGTTVSLVGLYSFYFGCLAQCVCDHTRRSLTRWLKIFSYTRTTLLSMACFFVGLGLCLVLVVHYLSHNFKLPPVTSSVDHLCIVGILLMIIGFSTFLFTLVLHAQQITYGVHVLESEQHDGHASVSAGAV